MFFCDLHSAFLLDGRAHGKEEAVTLSPSRDPDPQIVGQEGVLGQGCWKWWLLLTSLTAYFVIQSVASTQNLELVFVICIGRNMNHQGLNIFSVLQKYVRIILL